jgi:phosphoribosylamine--glycine ligase
MGAYDPGRLERNGFVLDELYELLEERVFRPAVNGMRSIGTPYQGVLYAGVIVTPDGPNVLEFNCRFGDPETQAILPPIACDFPSLLVQCTDESLEDEGIYWNEDACATIVLTSKGYPGEYKTGFPIEGLAQAAALPNVYIFHSGTAFADGKVVTAGGRVLSVTARGYGSLQDALDKAYKAVRHIYFKGMHHRTDIGHTGFAREYIDAE